MHESGMIQSLLRTAAAEAERRNAELLGIDVRLGVLAGGSPEHLREHFEIELARLGLGPIALRIVNDPDYPAGVEIVGLELRDRCDKPHDP
jgi:hypothetical protein